jgi:hypothetical protein
MVGSADDHHSRGVMSKPDPLTSAFDAYLVATWGTASEKQRQEAIAKVSMDIDRRFNFRGAKADDRQRQEWPRTNARYADGTPIEGVPEEVKRATSFYAGCAVAGYTLRHPKVLARLLLILEPVLDPGEPFRGNLRPL